MWLYFFVYTLWILALFGKPSSKSSLESSSLRLLQKPLLLTFKQDKDDYSVWDLYLCLFVLYLFLCCMSCFNQICMFYLCVKYGSPLWILEDYGNVLLLHSTEFFRLDFWMFSGIIVWTYHTVDVIFYEAWPWSFNFNCFHVQYIDI